MRDEQNLASQGMFQPFDIRRGVNRLDLGPQDRSWKGLEALPVAAEFPGTNRLGRATIGKILALQ